MVKIENYWVFTYGLAGILTLKPKGNPLQVYVAEWIIFSKLLKGN